MVFHSDKLQLVGLGQFSKYCSVLDPDWRVGSMFEFVCDRLKMTNEEICQAVMSMDDQEELPKDMLEQV